MSAESRYAFDNAAPETKDRFGGLEAVFDPVTTRCLDRLGDLTGWRCWEVGVGGGSIARWLASRVGDSGSVIGTDINLQWAGDVPRNVDLIRHDVVTEPAPADDFDLVHARLVMIHLPQRIEVLNRLASSLRPGGWLVIEDFDDATAGLFSDDADDELFNRVYAAIRALLQESGADTSYARRLVRIFRSLGLVDVGAEGFVVFPTGSSPAATILQANLRQVGARLVERGHVPAADIERALELLDADSFTFIFNMLVSAWGQAASVLG
jgi:SAM-dependent methyltransferase